MVVIWNPHKKSHPIFQLDGMENLILRIIELLAVPPELQLKQS